MKQVFLIGVLLLAVVRVAGQSENIDSLVNVLETKKLSSEEQISIYNTVCYYYLNSEPQKAMTYIHKGLSLAEKEKNNKWILGFTTYLGRVQMREGNYNEALETFNHVLRVSIDEKMTDQEAQAYVSLAQLYQRQGDIETSLDFLLKSLAIYEKGKTVKHKEMVVTMLYNIGTIYRGLNNPDLAIQFYNKAEKYADELNFSEGKMQVYYGLADIYRGKNDYEKALNYSLKSLELSRSFNNKEFESANLGGLVVIYEQGFKDYTKAEKYANEELKIAKEMGDTYLITGALSHLAGVYINQEKYAEAEKAAMESWKMDSTDTDLGYMTTYYIGIANIF